MSSETQTIATLDDLYRVEGKAELIAGRIVTLMPTGAIPGRIGGRIYRKLDEYCETAGLGNAWPDNVGFAVPELSSGRQTFSPDAAYLLGDFPPNGMAFVDGAPTFAVEVRSQGNYGPAAEIEMAAKRDDYFEAGTLVVWDVDPDTQTISAYRSDSPNRPTIFGRGDMADAEPAVEGWRVAVDWIFA